MADSNLDASNLETCPDIKLPLNEKPANTTINAETVTAALTLGEDAFETTKEVSVELERVTIKINSPTPSIEV